MFSAAGESLGTLRISLVANIRDRKISNEIGLLHDLRILAPIIMDYPASIPKASERHAPNILKFL
jgi:hypothetical protein